MQNLIATKPGIQRISGITVFDTREMKSYEPLPDLEVSSSCMICFCFMGSYMFLVSNFYITLEVFFALHTPKVSATF